MKTPSSTGRLLLILLLFVLLPALIYSAFEINSLTESETILNDLYRRQLDAALSSVNQYAWDIVSTWADRITRTLAGGPDPEPLIREFLANTPDVDAVILTTIDAASVRSVGHGTGDSTAAMTTLQLHREQLERLARLSKADYRKLEAIPLENSTASTPGLMLAFVTGKEAGPKTPVAAVVLREDRFIRTTLGPKLREIAGEDFDLAVRRSTASQPLFETAPAGGGTFQQKVLWLFPDLMLEIRPRGTTIEQLVQARFRRSLTLILLLDILLLAGAWLLYRTIRKEMELVRLKSDFVSNVSHELRTPLSLIRMFAETLDMGRVPTEEKRREYTSTILHETERLTALVNRILNFSRMEAGKKQYVLAPLDVNGVVDGVLATYAAQLAAGGFSVTKVLDATLPSLSADRDAVTEALINLVDNAMKYSAEEKGITVRTGTEGHTVFIEVEDRGIGIAPEHHSKIFDKFYRVSGALVHNTKGSGLGLSLVRHIMDAHRGRVSVTSRPGKGSTFRLSFPRA